MTFTKCLTLLALSAVQNVSAFAPIFARGAPRGVAASYGGQVANEISGVSFRNVLAIIQLAHSIAARSKTDYQFARIIVKIFVERGCGGYAWKAGCQ